MERIVILVVDDEAVIRDGIKRVLEGDRFEVETCRSGHIAIERLQEKDYGLIITDLKMPGMDGVELLKAIRERDIQTPVIVLTGHVSIKQLAEVVKEGVAEVVLKPCRIDTLISCIENTHERKVFATQVAVLSPY